jgi:hypothetical protein
MTGSAPRTGPNAVDPRVASNRREHGGTRSRFAGGGFHHADRASAALKPGNAALVEGRSIFHNSVVDPAVSPRLLVSGMNNAKLGRTVEKGAWAGMPIFQLTLEERATCPRTCQLWAECMGNTMHLARRHAHGPALVARLEQELHEHGIANPRGFVVRLHELGDFYSVPYVGSWAQWMLELPMLHVWGYTARLRETPIGELIDTMNSAWPDRWRIRFSVAAETEDAPLQVTTIWRVPESLRQPEGLVCSQQFDKTASCGTCGLCWAPAKDAERIVFVGHGRNVHKGPRGART